MAAYAETCRRTIKWRIVVIDNFCILRWLYYWLIMTVHHTKCSTEIILAWFAYRVLQVYTKSGRVVTPETKCCTVAPNIFRIIVAAFSSDKKVCQITCTSPKRQITGDVHRSLQNCGSPLWDLLYVTLLAPIIRRWLVDFRKIYGFMECYNSSPLISTYWRYLQRSLLKTNLIFTIK
jgi:hypothetical protein